MGRNFCHMMYNILGNTNKSTNFSCGIVEPYSRTISHRKFTSLAKKKGIRLIVTLECTEAKLEGGTPSRYTTQKNKKNSPGRLELMKYNPLLRRHTLHREIK